MREFNIAAHTQIGMVIIQQQIHSKENRRNTDWFSRGGNYLEAIQSNVWLETAARWFHLADYEELTNDVEDFFTNEVEPINKTIHAHNYDGTTDPMYFHGPNAKPALVEPMEFFDDMNRHHTEMDREYIIMDFDKARRFREHAVRHPNQQFDTAH